MQRLGLPGRGNERAAGGIGDTAAALTQLRDQFDDTALRAAPVHSQVITERRATHACTPGHPRLAASPVAERIFLAGDYTYAEYPATLEAAVRAGVHAARAVLAKS